MIYTGNETVKRTFGAGNASGSTCRLKHHTQEVEPDMAFGNMERGVSKFRFAVDPARAVYTQHAI